MLSIPVTILCLVGTSSGGNPSYHKANKIPSSEPVDLTSVEKVSGESSSDVSYRVHGSVSYTHLTLPTIYSV